MSIPTTQQDFSDLLQHIQQSRQNVFTHVNTALIDLYWHIGKTISHKVQTQAWGKGVVSELACYIAQSDPSIKGFSDKNLWRMKQFYETYQADEKLAPLLRALPWTHNTIIFSRCKTAEEREFYLKLCSKERYASRELERQINAAQFERTLMGKQKLSAVLRTCFKSVASGSSARRTERRNRNVLDVHEDLEHRATQQSGRVAAFKTRS